VRNLNCAALSTMSKPNWFNILWIAYKPTTNLSCKQIHINVWRFETKCRAEGSSTGAYRMLCNHLANASGMAPATVSMQFRPLSVLGSHCPVAVYTCTAMLSSWFDFKTNRKPHSELERSFLLVFCSNHSSQVDRF